MARWTLHQAQGCMSKPCCSTRAMTTPPQEKTNASQRRKRLSWSISARESRSKGDLTGRMPSRKTGASAGGRKEKGAAGAAPLNRQGRSALGLLGLHLRLAFAIGRRGLGVGELHFVLVVHVDRHLAAVGQLAEQQFV